MIFAMPGNVCGAIFDTQVLSPESFAPSIFLAEQQGLKLEYVGLDKILDWPIDRLCKKAGSVAFFQLSQEFLRGFQADPNNPACAKFLKFFKIIGQDLRTTIILMLPPLGRDIGRAIDILDPLLNFAGMQRPLKVQEYDKLEALKNFLSNSIEIRKVGYHTSLVPPAGLENKFERKNNSNIFPCRKPNLSGLLDVFMPMAFNLTDLRKIVLSNSALFGLLGPTENFQLMPLQEHLVGDLIVLISQFFLEIKNFALGIDEPELVIKDKILTFKQLFEKLGFACQTKQINKKSEGSRNFSKVSWMEIDAFCQCQNHCQKEQDLKSFSCQKIVDRTLDAGLDWVWINLSPNTFLPKNGINASRSEMLMAGLSKFAQLLVSAALSRGVKVPKFLLGFELGNNIVGQNAPKNYATDIYCNAYTDIPEPLDFNFWKDELLKPLKMFLDEWGGLEVSKSFPVDGIVLDIEFYNRKWTGMFLPTMGFDKFSRESFCTKIGQKKGLKMPLENFVKKMADSGRFQDYFQFLELSAKNIAKRIACQVSKLLGDRPICVYVPNIVFDWFFEGFFSGLSEKRPIHIFSFNSRFDLIAQLMANKNINASHGSAVMLSKVTMHEDFDLIEKIFNQNAVSSVEKQTGGIWLNRFSRIGQPFQTGQWFFLEQSPASEARRDRFCRFLGGLN